MKIITASSTAVAVSVLSFSFVQAGIPFTADPTAEQPLSGLTSKYNSQINSFASTLKKMNIDTSKVRYNSDDIPGKNADPGQILFAMYEGTKDCDKEKASQYFEMDVPIGQCMENPDQGLSFKFECTPDGDLEQQLYQGLDCSTKFNSDILPSAMKNTCLDLDLYSMTVDWACGNKKSTKDKYDVAQILEKTVSAYNSKIASTASVVENFFKSASHASSSDTPANDNKSVQAINAEQGEILISLYMGNNDTKCDKEKASYFEEVSVTLGTCIDNNSNDQSIINQCTPDGDLEQITYDGLGCSRKIRSDIIPASTKNMCILVDTSFAFTSVKLDWECKKNSPTKENSSGSTIGIVIGSLAAVGVLVGVIVAVYIHKKKKSSGYQPLATY